MSHLWLRKYLRERYRLVRLLHDSDKTKLWLVEESKSRQKFLLKIINRTDLLYSEIAKIKHFALPEIYYVEESDAATYVVEEYLQGSDLQKYLDLRGALDEQTICRLAIELCDGLQELHKRHIIHRDIKPSNLFMTDAGNLKLIDFDAARMEKPGKFADTHLIGTPGFAAPEQYGFHQTDERADIYSLGLTLKLLLGYENYRGFLLPVLNKCIEFDPNKRFNSVQDLKRAITLRRRIYEWKNFIVAACVGIVSLIAFLSNTAPPVERPVIEEKISPPKSESQSIQPVVEEIAEKQPTEHFVAKELIVPVIINEPIYYETPAPQKLPSEVEDVSPAREMDYSAADSSEFQERGIPRAILEHQMKDLPTQERDEKIDEYHKRMELNRRQQDFAASLPDDMTQEEKNEAIMEFRRRTKSALGLK